MHTNVIQLLMWSRHSVLSVNANQISPKATHALTVEIVNRCIYLVIWLLSIIQNLLDRCVIKKITMDYQERIVWIQSDFCAYPNPGPGYLTSYVMVFVVLSELCSDEG